VDKGIGHFERSYQVCDVCGDCIDYYKYFNAGYDGFVKRTHAKCRCGHVAIIIEDGEED